MKKYFLATVMISALVISTQAKSATLDQQQLSTSGATSYSGSVLEAQTFTAGFDQRLDKIEVYIHPLNSTSADYPTTVTLRETISGKPVGSDLASSFYGSGFGGAGWFAIDFSQNNIFLTKGNMYALVFSNDQSSGGTGKPLNGVGVAWDPNAYSGGDLWTTFGSFPGWQLQTGFGSAGADMSFKTYGTPTVPVPATIWTFGSGLIGLAGFARRRR